MTPNEINQMRHMGNKLQKMADETARLEDRATLLSLVQQFDRIVTGGVS